MARIFAASTRKAEVALREFEASLGLHWEFQVS